ncbi:MAG TPA: NADH-quinone oxidoreductase subunit C [Vicinamibacterales bacterium]|nr:NADH-quinone oxidoreductase subunit C [Vicinamibacterales bacterium]
MSAAEIIAALSAAVPGATYEPLESADSAVTPVVLVPVAHLVTTCQALESTPGLEFHGFLDVTCADYYQQREPRFDVVYHLVSPHRRARVRLKVRVGNDEPVPSVTSVWPGAGWMEREVYDLFGVVFDGHPDLRRLLMPDDWEGHPLRKDYPVQVRKDATTYMPLQITEEEFRSNLERDRYVRPRPS